MENDKKPEEVFLSLHNQVIIPHLEKMNLSLKSKGVTLDVFSSNNFPVKHKPVGKFFDQIVLKPLSDNSGTSGSALGKPYLYIEINDDGKGKVIQSGGTATQSNITIQIEELNENKIASLINQFVKTQLPGDEI